MTRPKYDYLIVGAGLYGAMFAHTATLQGYKCFVIEKNDHIGGFCYTENVHGIEVHKFGAHIFRTDSRKVWDFVNGICEFIPFVNSPIANYQGRIYNLPFNMNTFNQIFGVTSPSEALEAIENDKVKSHSPNNLEEHCLATVGRTVYEMFIREYTEKQWGKKCTELPASIMKRIPVRYTYDNNYFSERYQGIPVCGYTEFITRLLSGCDVSIGTDFFEQTDFYKSLARKVVYTGQVDRFYDYRFGKLDYRSVKFKESFLPETDNYQGNAVVNYTDGSTPWTRTIEHKHFLKTQCNGTVLSYEIPYDYNDEIPPSYPIPTEENLSKYSRYKELADKEPNVIFGGRLAEYKYYSMNDIIEQFV